MRNYNETEKKPFFPLSHKTKNLLEVLLIPTGCLLLYIMAVYTDLPGLLFSWLVIRFDLNLFKILVLVLVIMAGMGTYCYRRRRELSTRNRELEKR